MKKVLAILLVLALALSGMALVACGEPDEDAIAVSFYDLDGNLLDTVEPVNGKVTPPSTAKDGMSFVGWFADVDGKVDLDGTPVDFSNFAVTESMSVYGSWTELTVIFRYVSGKAIAEVKVVDGKITAPTLTVADGFMFDGWYYGKTTVNADGSSTFALTEEWDGSVPSDSTELYANILNLEGSGAYHVTGNVVSGAVWWNYTYDAEANPEYGMEYDGDNFVYTQTIVIESGGFRILDTTVGAWSAGFTANNVGKVTVADDVVLPEGYTATFGDGATDLFSNEGGSDQNIALVNAGYQFELEITLNVGLNTIDIHILKATQLSDAPEVFGTAVVGTVYDGACGGTWFASKDKAELESGIFDVDADGVATGTVYFTNGNQFKIMPDTQLGWVGDIGFSEANAVVTFADGIDAIEGFLVDAGGNYGVVMPEGKVATVVVTYSAEGVVSFHVTEINDVPTYIIVGSDAISGLTHFDNTDSTKTIIDDEGELVEWTLTGEGIFKIMQTDDSDWSTALGYSYSHSLAPVDDDGELTFVFPEGTTLETFLTDDGNFKMGIEGYTTVFTIDFDMVANHITINIISITAVVADA